MKIRIGVTGRPRIGKSTILKEVIRRLKAKGLVVGGMLTADIWEGGRRVGFEIDDINSGKKGILAHIHIHSQQEGKERGPTPKVGKYGVNLKDLDALGANSIKNAVAHPGQIVIIIDEIGPMELKSKEFIHAVEEAMECDKDMIVSVHHKSEHGLVRRIKRDFEIFEVTMDNRDEIANRIVDKINANAQKMEDA